MGLWLKSRPSLVVGPGEAVGYSVCPWHMTLLFLCSLLNKAVPTVLLATRAASGSRTLLVPLTTAPEKGLAFTTVLGQSYNKIGFR